jgi:hypothetical protein
VTNNAPSAGNTLTFTATVTGTGAAAPSGSVNWSITGPASACNATSGPIASGNVSTYTCSIGSALAGTYNATASFEGDSQYGQAQGSGQATVSTQAAPASQTITFTAPASGSVGGSALLHPSASSGLAVSLSVDRTTTIGSCSLSGDTVHYLRTGSCVIDANQAGNADYSAAPQVQQSVQVSQAPGGHRGRG